ncbi:MAG: hypothetical protein JXA98_08735 [Methanosarcinaceae archaeon]|nr:hypothetical protein [Methanosarcinaceae archaeon]
MPGLGIFNISDLSLLDQTIAFLVLMYALFRKRTSISMHGKIAGIAFLLAVPSIIYMLYSGSKGLVLNYYGFILTLHRLLGILTILSAIMFVGNQWKWKKKIHMDIGLLCWALAFILGITVYLLHYGFISP